MQREYKFNELPNCDLIVDALYRGGTKGNAGDDPLSKLLDCENQGGFRKRGTTHPFQLHYVVIYSTLMDLDWMDFLDEVKGLFTYFGDNKIPGHMLHETRKKGNLVLRESFNRLHIGDRISIPPFFVFTKGIDGRDVVFRGLAVPGAKSLNQYEDLIAIWKSKDKKRFQNYKAIFTILDVAEIKREWLSDLVNGNMLSDNCPKVYQKWVEKGVYKPLKAEKTIEIRKKNQQIPANQEGMKIIGTIHKYFDGRAHDFEKCAAELVKMMDTNIISCDVTRPTRDGGRDAIGKYAIGLKDNAIEVEFALEAKCYNMKNSVGVKETSRLISRIRNRQFGIIVTTSYVGDQAYKEIKEDSHPIIIISAVDIVEILSNIGYTTVEEVREWLKKQI